MVWHGFKNIPRAFFPHQTIKKIKNKNKFSRKKLKPNIKI
jgi:hypothetical protein